jgi:GNAT superfamily N-acetyltransferase
VPLSARSPEVLKAPDGRILARYEPDERTGGRPWADLFVPEPGADLGEVVEAVTREMAGHLVSTWIEVAEALIAAGATAERRGHIYSHDLRSEMPAIPYTALTLRPASDFEPSDLVEACMEAYPPDHIDFLPGEDDPAVVERRLVELMHDGAIGPLMDCSRVAVDADGRVAGAALVVDMPRPVPFGGPWLAELFRRSDARGEGRRLLAATIHAAAGDGCRSFGLVVTDGNPARTLYERVGCRYVGTFVNVLV